MRRIRITALCLLMLPGQPACAQDEADTAEMVNQFISVMSFATQPYLHFTTVTKMNAAPVFSEQDTMSVTGTFYKNQTDLYYSSGPEEMYLQDSFMLQINQKRKSIWISKVDIDFKAKMNVLPVSNKQLQTLFKNEYTLQKTTLKGLNSILYFKAKQAAGNETTITTSIKLEYVIKDFMPLMMEVEMRMQQPLDNNLADELNRGDVNDTRLLQTIQGKKYRVRLQSIIVTFGLINNTKEEAIKIPSWKDVFDYKEAGQEFTPKGLYKDYEVTITF